MYLILYSCVCVSPAAAGRLGGRCHWWHLCGCQQQVQTDGLWLCQVCVCPIFSLCLRKTVLRSKRLFACVCVTESDCCPCGVCPLWESVSLCLQRLPHVCLSETPHGSYNLPAWQEFLFLTAPFSSSSTFSSVLFVSCTLTCDDCPNSPADSIAF